ncbi:MAG: hypothetical protein ACXVCY_18200 [Pseudobdellovibrionaceae bacterium]
MKPYAINRALPKAALLSAVAGTIMFFQNCSSNQVGFQEKVTATTSPSLTSSSNEACTTPWGEEIPNGEKQIAFEASSVTDPNSCVSQERVCEKGQLSGTYAFKECTVNTLPANSQNCLAPWGATIRNGDSVTAFASSSVPIGSECSSQSRICTNGILSGSNSYSAQSCSVDNGFTCNDYATACTKAAQSCTGTQCVFSGCGLATFVVPNNVSTLTIKMWGAGGAGNPSGEGGAGGFMKGTLSVTPGQTLEIGVAQSGCVGGGGGASFIREKISKSLYIVAGGGGGGGSDGNSGANGNIYLGIGGCNDSAKAVDAPLASLSYNNYYGRVGGGTSGSASSGGAGGSVLATSADTQNSIPTEGRPGSFMTGGAGVIGTNPPSPNSFLGAQYEVGGRGDGNGGSGGGGAGYYGGGSGGSRYTYFGAGGGGGSCYFNGAQLIEKTPGVGKVSATHADDPQLNYIPGQGGIRIPTSNANISFVGGRGANGAVVISY